MVIAPNVNNVLKSQFEVDLEYSHKFYNLGKYLKDVKQAKIILPGQKLIPEHVPSDTFINSNIKI